MIAYNEPKTWAPKNNFMPIPLVTHPHYSYSFPDSHRFPMEKFALLHEYLQYCGIAQKNNIFRPGKAKWESLELAHCPKYIHRFTNNQQSSEEVRRMGLPWSEGLVERTLISPNGTLLTAKLALDYGVACHLAGGTHHAHRDVASGFCILNDLAVTAKTLLAQGKVNRVLIFDCDVHQGDGTATILADDSGAFTCSIHCEKNFPVRKAQSDRDIDVAVGMGDRDYLAIVEQTFEKVLSDNRPDLVLYDAGVDVFAEDPLGLLNISLDGLRERECIVLEICHNKNIPIATVIGGGYGQDRRALAKRHALVTESAQAIYQL